MRVQIVLLAIFLSTVIAGTLRAEETNPILGKVGDFVLREADLDRIMASQLPSVQKQFQEDPQRKISLVREILIKKAIVDKAKKSGFDKRPEMKEQLSYVFDNFISQEYVEKVVINGIAVPEADQKKYYLDHEKDFIQPEQIKVRHILIVSPKDAKPEEREKARQKAELILQRIGRGEDFGKLAKDLSEDPVSASKGGELSPITPGKTNSVEFEKAAFALKKDQVSGVVETSYGFHIIKMDDKQEKWTASFDEVKSFIYNKLKTDLEQKKAQEFVEQTSKDAGLEIFNDKITGEQENSKNHPAAPAAGEGKK